MKVFMPSDNMNWELCAAVSSSVSAHTYIFMPWLISRKHALHFIIFIVFMHLVKNCMFRFFLGFFSISKYSATTVKLL